MPGARSNVDLDVNEGETLAIVGESGSGKSTLRMLLGLSSRPRAMSPIMAFRGCVQGAGLGNLSKSGSADLSGPGSSLNPRMRVDTPLSNVLLRHGLATRDTLAPR